jgi:cell division protein FtsZ
VNEAAEVIHGVAHPDANIIFGAVIDDEMGDEVRVTVIAAGFDRWDEGKGRGRPGEEDRGPDLFGDVDDDEDLDGDDEFDVPSFLK